MARYTGSPKTASSIWQGIETAAAARGSHSVLCPSDAPAQAQKAVNEADAVVVALTGYPEGESDDRDILGFPPSQVALLEATVSAARASKRYKPVVVLLLSGGALDSSLAVEKADAVVAMYRGGEWTLPSPGVFSVSWLHFFCFCFICCKLTSLS